MNITRNPGTPLTRFATWILAAGLVLALAGCATKPTNPRDPFEPFNRKALQFNEGVDAMVLKPVATVYRAQVPPLVRTGVSNFFGNLSDGWSFINSALQFKFRNAAENFMRLNVNTFFGLGGILDIASDMNIERHREDFGQTLGRWGVPAGPYIMLPLLGPSTMRDTLALPIDWTADPVYYVKPSQDRFVLGALRTVDKRSNSLRVGAVLEEAALDKYTFIRDTYLQKRRADIFDREMPADGSVDAPSDGAVEPPAAPLPGQPASAPAR
ncbi:VacJ family lipoprotein [Caenimonas terrae]|uniref:VacJ family lipoprotein n=1 Tax=Caenimonas terrae TaxID=696074 RepID=A0ABW0NJ99_9BURK